MKTQFNYTYKIACRYANCPDEVEIHYFCDDEPNITPSIMDDLKFLYEDEEKGEVSIEIIDKVNNYFVDRYLSQELIYLLNGSPKFFIVEYCEEYRQYLISKREMLLAYIYYIDFDCREDMEIYARGLVKSIIKNIVCHPYQIDINILNGILFRFFGKGIDREESIKRQLHLLLDENKEKERRYTILCKLTTKENTSTLRAILDKMNKKYHLSYEAIQKKVGAVLLLFAKRYSKFSSTVAGKYSTIAELISEYYEITPPQYRQDVLNKFIDKDWDKYFKNSKTPQKDRTFINRISKVDSSFWNSL